MIGRQDTIVVFYGVEREGIFPVIHRHRIAHGPELQRLFCSAGATFNLVAVLLPYTRESAGRAEKNVVGLI